MESRFIVNMKRLLFCISVMSQTISSVPI